MQLNNSEIMGAAGPGERGGIYGADTSQYSARAVEQRHMILEEAIAEEQEYRQLLAQYFF